MEREVPGRRKAGVEFYPVVVVLAAPLPFPSFILISYVMVENWDNERVLDI